MKSEERIMNAVTSASARKARENAVRIRIGTVISVNPVKIRVAETEQDASHFWCDAFLISGYRRMAAALDVNGRLSVVAGCSEGSISSIQINSGLMHLSPLQITDAGFSVNDKLLLLSDDDQTFFIISKVVKLE